MIRIKDIAKEANVSEGTVDRVLHNRPGVSKKTEQKIRKILERRNFSVNPVASALAMKNNHTIAVLIPEFNETDSFWKLPYLGILKASHEVRNIGVRVSWFTFNQYNPTSYWEAFYSLMKTKPTAVLLVPMFLKETSLIVNELKLLTIPYTFLNIDIENDDNSAYVGQDSYMAGYIAGKLLKLSIPREGECGIIRASKSAEDNQSIAKRIKGFKDYYKKNNDKNKVHELKVDSFNNDLKLSITVHQFLEKYPAIKGIFVPSSRIAAIVHILPKQQAEKLQLIGFDNTPQNVICLKNDTVLFLISQKPFDQGYEAFSMLSNYLIKDIGLTQKLYLPIDILTKENVDYNDIKQLIVCEPKE